MCVPSITRLPNIWRVKFIYFTILSPFYFDLTYIRAPCASRSFSSPCKLYKTQRIRIPCQTKRPALERPLASVAYHMSTSISQKATIIHRNSHLALRLVQNKLIITSEKMINKCCICIESTSYRQ